MGFQAIRSEFAKSAIPFCFFVVCLAALPPSSLFASCGDYLHHPSGKLLLHASAGEVSETSDRPVSPASRCRNGDCHSAPPTAPVDPTRLTFQRQQPDHQIQGSRELTTHRSVFPIALNELLLTTPCFDVVPPPPKSSASL